MSWESRLAGVQVLWAVFPANPNTLLWILTPQCSAHAQEARDIFKALRPFLNRCPSENIAPSLVEENFPKEEEKPMKTRGGRMARLCSAGGQFQGG